MSRRDELFDLSADPAESKDVLAANTAQVTALKRRLTDARDRGYTRPGAGK